LVFTEGTLNRASTCRVEAACLAGTPPGGFE
jgi:hypothetical protein